MTARPLVAPALKRWRAIPLKLRRNVQAFFTAEAENSERDAKLPRSARIFADQKPAEIRADARAFRAAVALLRKAGSL